MICKLLKPDGEICISDILVTKLDQHMKFFRRLTRCTCSYFFCRNVHYEGEKVKETCIYILADGQECDVRVVSLASHME